jgi:hypothetical protein
MTVNLTGLRKSKRTAIIDRWTDLALRVYPHDSGGFIAQEKDRFRNPVGHVTRASLGALFDGLLTGRPAEAMRESLDDIVRIRAVQDLSPAEALGFVFLLKRALREELGEAATQDSATDLSALDSAIDRLALQAFDLFMEYRESIYDLRVREIKRRTSRLLERRTKGGGAL